MFKPEIAKGAESSIELQKQIDMASPYATIRLSDGIYQGPILIDKPLTILGGKQTRIEAEGSESIIQIHADDVTLRGLSIRNTEKSPESVGSGVTLSGNRIRLLNNRIARVHYGVHVKKGTQNEMIGNVIIGLPELPVHKRGNGIQLDHSDYNRIEENQLLDIQDGVYFDYAHHNEVRGNLIKRSRYGFHLMGADHNQITDNGVQDSITGAMVMETKGTVIQGNRFSRQRDSQGYGLFLYSSVNGTIEDNIIVDNTKGLGLDSIQGNRILRNTISSNAVAVKIFGSITDTHFSANVFSGNVRQVEIRNPPPEDLWNLNEVGNYWDDYDGMDWNGDHIGDIPYENKSFLSTLFQKKPALQLWFASPAYSLVESMVAPSLVRDDYPLISPPNALQRTSFVPFSQNQPFFLILTGGVLAIYLIRRSLTS